MWRSSDAWRDITARSRPRSPNGHPDPSGRILGLGHTAISDLAEVLANHAASTPTAAGEHVRRGVMEAGKLVRTSRQLRELREALAAKEMELAKERQTVRLEEPEKPDVTEETFRGIERRLTVPA